MSVNEFTTGKLVEFKGSKKGIIVNIKRKATFDEIKNSIIDKLESAIGFFNGAKICSINCVLFRLIVSGSGFTKV